jgi:hypothetical protein
MTLVLRVLALIGSMSHAADRLVARVVGSLPFGLPGWVPIAVALAAAAWFTGQATANEMATRPRPTTTTVGALVDSSTSTWVSVAGLISGPHLDNAIYASDRRTYFMRISDDPHDHVYEGGGEQIIEPGWRRQTIFTLTEGDGVTRWFYVLREADGNRALVVRSARGAEGIRTRSVRVESAGDVDGLPLLVETADAGNAAPAQAIDSVNGEATVRASFGDASEVTCDGGPACRDGRAWRYAVSDAADPAKRGWIDSPHAPDALPVTLEGVVATDATRMRVILDTPEMRDAVEGLEHREELVLADGIGPPIRESSYVPAILLAMGAGLLIVSAAIRYPVFRPGRRSVTGGGPRPVVEELIPVDVHGEMPGASGSERVVSAPGRIGWIPARDLTRRAWHLHRAAAPAADAGPRLAVLAVEGNFVLPIDEHRGALAVDVGTVATSAALQPALRLRAPDLSVILGFGSERDRARIVRELAPDVEPPSEGPVPASGPARRRAQRPWIRAASASALAFVAVLLVVDAAVGALITERPLVAVAAGMAGAATMAVLAVAVLRRHALASELLPSVALLGVVVAGVGAIASLGCGTWLTPNVEGCAGWSPLTLATPLLAAIALAFALWTVPHLNRPRAS